jgi:hypothetical protein
MGGNKTPIIDENEPYNQAEPWVDSYFERLVEDPKVPVTTVVLTPKLAEVVLPVMSVFVIKS